MVNSPRKERGPRHGRLSYEWRTYPAPFGNDMNFEEAVGNLNADYFFQEFTFSSNTFKPTPQAELELADKVVWLGDLLIAYQIKEREAPANTTPQRERRWFEDEVVKKATRQIRDTLSYLSAYPDIELRNGRGHTFNIATVQIKHFHKLVVYHPHELLPTACARKKYHRSRKANVIVHLIHSEAYLQILQTLITPVEIAEYLTYRESLVVQWDQAASAVSEKALLGHYLRNLPNLEPTAEFEQLVDKLLMQDKDWDIAPIIKRYFERRNTPESPQELAYTVLRALATMYRTEMATFKQRFRLSMGKALSDEAFIAHRFSTSRGYGFVFIPLQRKELPSRLKALRLLTALNKYDQHLDHCIGMAFIADGEKWCDVRWYPLDAPWQEDPALQAILDDHYPFRPVTEKSVDRYNLSE